jgi:glucans biosynthesis protein
VAARAGRGSAAKRRRFIVEFAGDIFAAPSHLADLKPALTASPGTVTSLRTFVSAERKTCRVLFELDPGSEISSELRLVLEAAGNPISETWLYRWTL